ncbi:MAG: hypothetical protein JNM74_08130 [Myxococcales bacterium]|nr:hypothetical protein [Myxococcales bacterium]
MRRRIVIPSLLLALGAPARAQAEEASSTRWYGYQTIAVDATSIGLLAAAGAVHEDAMPWLAGSALGLYALGPVVVHGANGRGIAGLGSLGLRVGLPLVGAFLGLGVGAASSFKGMAELAAGGAFVGAVGAMVLDAAFLARASTAPDPATQPSALTFLVPFGATF